MILRGAIDADESSDDHSVLVTTFLRIQRILGPAPNAMGAAVTECNSTQMKVDVPDKHKFQRLSHVPYLWMDSITMSYDMYQVWSSASLPPSSGLRYPTLERIKMDPQIINASYTQEAQQPLYTLPLNITEPTKRLYIIVQRKNVAYRAVLLARHQLQLRADRRQAAADLGILVMLD